MLSFITARPHWYNADRCNSQSYSVRRSIRLSVYPSHSVVQVNEYAIMRFSASRRKIMVVSGEVKFIRIFTPAKVLRWSAPYR